MRELQSLIDVKKAPSRYVDVTGDTMTGNLNFRNGSSPVISNANNGSATFHLDYLNNIPRIRYGGSGDGTQNGFEIQGTGDAIKFKVDNNGELYAAGTKRVYHTSFKPSAADVGALALGGGTLTGNLTVQNTGPNLTIKNTNNADAILTFDRGVNANWRLKNSSGTLYFECDYTGSKGSYYTGAKLDYNSGNFTAKGELYAQNGQRVYHTNNKPTWNDIQSKPSTFAPSSHNHAYIVGGTNNKVQTDQPNDFAGLDKKNNVNIDTWYGFSISNKCASDIPVDGVAFSVNARNGMVWAKGDIYAKGNQKVYHPGNKPNSILVRDVRDTNPTPAQMDNNAITTWFNNQYGDGWRSGITVKGWTGDYCAWQLGSFASTSIGETLSFRAGAGSTWNPWRRIYHEGFKPTPYDIGAVATSTLSQSATANSVALRDNSGDIYARLFRSTYQNQDTMSGAIAFRVNNSSDNYTRYCSNPTAVRNWIGAAASSHSHDVISTKTVTDWNTAQTNGFWQGESKPNAPESSGWFWGFRMQHGSGYGAQIAVGNGNSKIYFRSQTSDGSGTWHRMYHTGNKPTAADVGAMAAGGTYGTIYLTDWFRAKGSTGLYFQDYGGGWNMTDSTWIRAYNNKGIYTGGTINAGNVQVSGNNVYHTGRKPSCADIGAMKMSRMGSSAHDFYIMGDIYGSPSVWLRTPEQGLLPYSPGTSMLGSPGDGFNSIYANYGNFDKEIKVNGTGGRVMMNGSLGDSGDLCLGWDNKVMGRISILKGTSYGITSNRWLKIAVADENDKEDVLFHMNAEGGNWIIHSASLCGQSDNSRDLGSPNYRYKKVYSAGGVATSSDEKMKQNIKYIDKKPTASRSKRNAINLMTVNSEEDLDNFEIKTNDCYNFIKDTPYATYFYKKKVRSDASTEECEKADKNNTFITPSSDDFMVGFIAQDVARSKVGRMFLDYYEDTGYNYNLNNYVGIIAKALQEAMIKIEALESQLIKK